MTCDSEDLRANDLKLESDFPAPHHRRGRPNSQEGRRVYSALLEAAEQCLESKRYSDITVREVAAKAGVAQGMVNYYFSGRDGLFIGLVEFLFGNWSTRLREIENIRHGEGESPTRSFVEAVRDCFYKHRSILWLLDQQMRDPGSVFHKAFQDRLASRSTAAILRFVKIMVERGIYRAVPDLRYQCYAIAALAIFPVVSRQRMEHSYGISLSELTDGPWLKVLEENLDRLLRP